ncbi:hypothetical protein [Ottowia sp. VDI28]|uniref:hypothetical protein n=1 Tax=Ottowia sp. VDI28 TaxID=3133968 RepID=UPI003C301ADA
MTTNDVPVTYSGREDPFVDRIYRTGLTFTPGQTRVLPGALAARFLRHADVFQRGKTAEELTEEAQAAAQAAEELARKQAEAKTEADRIAAEQAAADAKRVSDEAAEAARKGQEEAQGDKKDDTAALLARQEKEQDQARQKEDARFALLDQIDSMDKKAVAEWAMDHYKQKIPGNLGDKRAREMAKGFVDQYGMP